MILAYVCFLSIEKKKKVYVLRERCGKQGGDQRLTVASTIRQFEIGCRRSRGPFRRPEPKFLHGTWDSLGEVISGVKAVSSMEVARPIGMLVGINRISGIGGSDCSIDGGWSQETSIWIIWSTLDAKCM